MKYNLALIAVLWSSGVSAQTPSEKFQGYYREAMQAAERKNYSAMVSAFRSADSIRPNTYAVIYNLAAALVLNGQPEKAAPILKRALWINASKQFEKDSDFVSLWGLPAYRQILYLADSLSQPVHRAENAFELDDSGFHPEGIALDRKTGRWFIGSIRTRRIIVREHDGSQKDFLRPQAGFYCMMGMRLDESHRKLWVATSAMPEMEGYADSLDGMAAILRINADDGSLEKIYTIPGKHVFGDLVVHPSGDIYISDSREPWICKIDRQTDQLTEWLKLESGWNLQGIDQTPDQKYLIIADYISGLYRITINDRSAHKIITSNVAALRGIDGMVVYKNAILGIQNGVNPFRVCRYFMNSDFSKIERFEFLESGTEFLGEPTLGLVSNGTFYFVANSPWGAYDRQGRFDITKAKKPLIMKYDLKP